jgi:alpha-tubulin suppressor-like RCC1 family protein
MKKWLFLFMAFLIFTVVSGCNSNLSSTALIETANQTTITTTIEDQTTTTQTTSGGTISETTLYLVEFDSGGAGVVPSQGVLSGELVDEPDITKEDHSLDGWYLSNDGGVTFIKKWDFENDTVTENITLYAQWNLILDTFEIHYYLLPEGYNPITDDLVMEVPKFMSVSIRSYFTVALTENHEVYTWGYNEYYQLGNGQTANKNVPTNITSFFNLDEFDYIIQVEAGYMHSLALTNNGKVYAWGDNEDGELGTGNTDVYEAPVDITSNFELLPDELIVSIDCGNYHSAALTNLGRLFMWGDNSIGQLGTDEFSDTTSPIDITSIFNLHVDEVIMTTALGGNHSLALTSEHRVFSWGFNYTMQLGDGTNVTRTTPLDITDNFNLELNETIDSITAGSNHSGAISNLGNVYTFGYNVYGQLGDGTSTNQGIPVKINDQFILDSGEYITDLFMGVHFSSAITNLQKIFTWGLNETGQLGDESYMDSSDPINISHLFAFNNERQILSVSLGNGYIAVVDTLGEMYLWGDNYLGQLGISSYIDKATPQNPSFWIPEVLIFSYIEGDYYDLYLPERTGDNFIGWYIDSRLTEQFDFLINPDGPTILYSKWESFPAILLKESVFLNPDDYHYYTFTIYTTSSITIYTLSEIDTYGVLRDEAENVIAENDDADSSTYNFSITYTLEPGTYTIEVSGYDETETGPYELYIIKN